MHHPFTMTFHNINKKMYAKINYVVVFRTVVVPLGNEGRQAICTTEKKGLQSYGFLVPYCDTTGMNNTLDFGWRMEKID